MVPSPTMHARDVGSCERCGATIGSSQVLIEYETGGGVAAYAECPDCRAVVRPK